MAKFLWLVSNNFNCKRFLKAVNLNQHFSTVFKTLRKSPHYNFIAKNHIHVIYAAIFLYFFTTGVCLKNIPIFFVSPY